MSHFITVKMESEFIDCTSRDWVQVEIFNKISFFLAICEESMDYKINFHFKSS